MNRLKIVLASTFGIGYFPIAPGTWASLFVLPLIWIISSLFSWYALIPFFILVSLLSLWSTDAAEQKWGKDPSMMVIDEWAGQILTFCFVPLTLNFQADWIILLAGFILFRFFDILKPLGIDKLQKFEGGWGVLLDDLLAGLYALVILNILIFTAL